MPSEDGGELLVIRFSPFSTDGLLKNARTTYLDDQAHGREARWGVSVYADLPRAGETVDEMLVRICRDAPVGGRQITTVLASLLEDAGFRVVEDEPPLHHRLVLLQDDPARDDVDHLQRVLCSSRRVNPAWKGR